MSTRPDLFSFTEEEIRTLGNQQQRQQSILSPFACKDEEGLREFTSRYQDPNCYIARPCFVTDVEKIIHNPFYSRCMDKTQVFSLIRNDDITRRSFHLQVVSRVGRTIGAALGLNLDLIEAIAVGHDMGHTPFGHQGEHYLSDLYHANTGRYFNHNVQSVRLLKTVARTNLCLQTYSGILAHCGEKAFVRYEPEPLANFDQFHDLLESCYHDQQNIAYLRPNTLEGCVVRISDIIAYVGKDRQDAARVRLASESDFSESSLLGTRNYEIIQNTTRNIIKNSLGKPYLSMDEEVFEALDALRKENARVIYLSDPIKDRILFVEPMIERLYARFIADLEEGREDSPIFRHHVRHPLMRYDYEWELANRPDDVVVDYLSSMTDDYFIELFRFLYPQDPLNEEVHYSNYF